jgi:hypothetical protein
MVYSGCKGVSKLIDSQIKLKMFLNKKARFLYKIGQNLLKTTENHQKITLLLFLHIHLFWC